MIEKKFKCEKCKKVFGSITYATCLEKDCPTLVKTSMSVNVPYEDIQGRRDNMSNVGDKFYED